MVRQDLDITDPQPRTEGSAKRRRLVYGYDNCPSQLESLPNTSYSSEEGSPVTGSSTSIAFNTRLHNRSKRSGQYCEILSS